MWSCIWGWWNSLCWLIKGKPTHFCKSLLLAIPQSFKLLLEERQILGRTLQYFCLFLLCSQSLEETSLIGHGPSFIWSSAETQNTASCSHPTNVPESTKEMPFARLLLYWVSRLILMEFSRKPGLGAAVEIKLSPLWQTCISKRERWEVHINTKK